MQLIEKKTISEIIDRAYRDAEYECVGLFIIEPSREEIEELLQTIRCSNRDLAA